MELLRDRIAHIAVRPHDGVAVFVFRVVVFSRCDADRGLILSTAAARSSVKIHSRRRVKISRKTASERVMRRTTPVRVSLPAHRDGMATDRCRTKPIRARASRRSPPPAPRAIRPPPSSSLKTASHARCYARTARRGRAGSPPTAAVAQESAFAAGAKPGLIANRNQPEHRRLDRCVSLVGGVELVHRILDMETDVAFGQ